MLFPQRISLSYACSFSVPSPTNPFNSSTPLTVTIDGRCADKNITLTPTGTVAADFPLSVMCNQICYVSLGTSTYVLFASLLLSLVYMLSLVLRYHRLAKIFRATQRTLATEMEKLLSDESADSKDGPPPSSRDVVLAMLAKS